MSLLFAFYSTFIREIVVAAFFARRDKNIFVVSVISWTHGINTKVYEFILVG